MLTTRYDACRPLKDGVLAGRTVKAVHHELEEPLGAQNRSCSVYFYSCAIPNSQAIRGALSCQRPVGRRDARYWKTPTKPGHMEDAEIATFSTQMLLPGRIVLRLKRLCSNDSRVAIVTTRTPRQSEVGHRACEVDWPHETRWNHCGVLWHLCHVVGML